MEKLKEIIKAILTVMQSDMFKWVITTASLAVAIFAVSWGALMTVLTDDLKNVVIEKEREIANLESRNEYLNSENVRLRIVNDDLYQFYEYNQDSVCR